MGKSENSGFFRTIAASDLKGRRSRHLIEFTKVCEGQGHFLNNFLYHISSSFFMFCALLGQAIR